MQALLNAIFPEVFDMKVSNKITVIGGSGFVGTNLCQALADRQIPFEIIDIKQSQSFPEKCKIGDVRDLQSLREAITGDVVVNLAAVHRDDIRDKTEYVRTNVDGAENVAKVCSEKNIRKIVFTSSVAVYGFAEPGTDEAGAINPFNEYGKTKYQAEEKLRAWNSSGDNDLIIVRPTVIFGEGNRGNVYNLLRQIASGNFIMVGSGKNRKSMAYIGNIVAFLEKCIEAERKYAVASSALDRCYLGICCRWLYEPNREKIAAELYTREKVLLIDRFCISKRRVGWVHSTFRTPRRDRSNSQERIYFARSEARDIFHRVIP